METKQAKLGINATSKTPVKVSMNKVKALSQSMGACNISGKKGAASRGSSMKQTSSGDSTQPSMADKNVSGQCSSMTKEMYVRWHAANKHLPQIDKNDIQDECPLFNNGLKSKPEHQQHPEFTQSSYMRLRQLEAEFPRRDYTITGSKVTDTMMGNKDRIYGMQRICYLHEQKGYKPESLFVAASIFDQYIAAVGIKNFPRKQVILLATISVLMSAKLEQPISPSFSRMISLLTDEEQYHVDKKGLIKLEAQILQKFGFDFNFQGPIAPLERYLRILNYDKDPSVFKLCFQILKGSLTNPRFMQYNPSKMAACALITSINIFEKDREHKLPGDFFAGCKDKFGKRMLNTDIWNNKVVHEMTGYSITDLSICLYELDVFCADKLKAHQLEEFDLEAIRSVERY